MDSASLEGWRRFDGGRSIGERGSEGGVILFDEDHEAGARITIERDGHTAPFSITCGLYGSMVHTRFFTRLDFAVAECRAMMPELARLASESQELDEWDWQYGNRMAEEFQRFVERFPLAGP